MIKNRTRDFLINIIIFSGILIALRSCTKTFDLDDTDNKVTGERSGVVPITDHLTGCQYLKTLWGGITPRMDSDGNQVGCY